MSECGECGGSGQAEVCMQCRQEPDHCRCLDHDPHVYDDVEQEFDIEDCQACGGTGEDNE